MSDVKSQMSDVRSQKSEVRSQKLIINIRIMEIRNGSIEASGGQAGAYARGLLMLNGASDYKEPVYLPDVMVNRKLKTSSKEKVPEYFKVYPNPADRYFTIEYKLIGVEGEAFLKIINNESKPVLIRELKNSEDCVLIDITDYAQGTYVVYIEVDGTIIDRKVVTVTK